MCYYGESYSDNIKTGLVPTPSQCNVMLCYYYKKKITYFTNKNVLNWFHIF